MCFLAFSHQYYYNFSFQSHRLLFSHASAEVRGENTPERKVASTGDRTHNHQVMSPTRSPLSHPGGEKTLGKDVFARYVVIYFYSGVINSLPSIKVLDMSKFKAFVDGNINVIQKLKLVSVKEKNMLYGNETHSVFNSLIA